MPERQITDTELCDMFDAFVRDLEAVRVSDPSGDAARRLMIEFTRRISALVVRDVELTALATDPRPPETSVQR